MAYDSLPIPNLPLSHDSTIAEKSQHCQLQCDGGTYTITIEQTDPRTPHHTRPHPNRKISTTNSPSYLCSQKIQHWQNPTRPPKKAFLVSHVPSCNADTLGLFLGFCFCWLEKMWTYSLHFKWLKTKTFSLMNFRNMKYGLISLWLVNLPPQK